MTAARQALLTLACILPCTASAQVQYVPLEFRTVEGIRPFVPVEVNGTPFVFMVHANASFYVMSTHANAAKAGVAERFDGRFYDVPHRFSRAMQNDAADFFDRHLAGA